MNVVLLILKSFKGENMTKKKRKINIILLSVLLIVSSIMIIVASFGVSHDRGFISLIIVSVWGFAFALAVLMALISEALD